MKKEDGKKSFFARCGEKLLEPSFKGIPRYLWIISAIFFWGLTKEGLFREKDGALWFLYRYFPPPLNNVLLWELIGPFLVGISLLLLYNYFRGKVAAIKEEVESPLASPDIRKQVKRESQITSIVGLALFGVSVLMLAGSGGADTKPVAQPFLERLPSPFSNIFLWLWLLWVGGGALVLFSLALRVALGEMSWQALLKDLTAEKQEEVHTGSKQIFRSLKEKLLRRLRGDRDKDKQDRV